MTPDMVATVSVGAALAALVLTMFRIMLKRMDRLEARIDRLEDRVNQLGDRVGRLEGLIDGLREALFDRASR